MTHDTANGSNYYTNIRNQYNGLGLKLSPIRETSISPVLVNGEFMTIAFITIKTNDEKFFINIGKANAYANAVYGSDAGTVIITGNGEWYETTKEEMNQLYTEIKNSRKISKKGRIYYTMDPKKLVE